MTTFSMNQNVIDLVILDQKWLKFTGFPQSAKICFVNRQSKYGPTFFITDLMHHLLGLGRSFSKTVSEIWDSSVSWRNLIFNMYNISVIEC